MNILQLCNKVPYPPKDGGCLAMHALTDGLTNEGNKVTVFAINTSKHFVEIEKLPAEYIRKTAITAVFVDTRVKMLDALFNLFSCESYNIKRFYSKIFEEKLIALLKHEQFDIVQLESIYVSMYSDVIRKYSKAKIVLRAHNVEHKIWERNVKQARNPLKKAYLSLLAKRLKRYELSCLKNVDAIVAITKEDELYFKNAGFDRPMITAPFGIELKHIGQFPATMHTWDVFHLGAMDWLPNIEGVNWFLENVWDKVIALHPEVKLYLAGKNMNPEALSAGKRRGVVLAGEIENAHEFMQSKGIMIVPLFAGGGMRVKLIEGLVMGKTIVTTAIGAEGVNCTNNKNCLIANTPDEFVMAIDKCLRDEQFCVTIGKNAQDLIKEKYNNAAICNALNDFYKNNLSVN